VARLGRAFILVSAALMGLGRLSVAAPAAHSSADATCVWHALPTPAGVSGVSQAVFEPGNVLWILTPQGPFYWDGKAFVPPTGPRLQGGQHLASFFGGPDRGAYLSQRGERERQGKLYRLSDGQAWYVTDFYYDSSGCPPGIYVARSGAIYNWSQRSLAVYDNGEWHKNEVKLGLRGVNVLDIGQLVYFHYGDRVYSLDPKGNLTEDILPPAMAQREGYEPVRAALWGEHCALFLHSGLPGLHAYDLAARKPVPLDDANDALTGASPYSVYRAGDGAVWIQAYDREKQRFPQYRLTPDGKLRAVERLGELTTSDFTFGNGPGLVLAASDGSIWFALRNGCLARCTADRVRRFGWHEGVPCGWPQQLLQGPDGTVYHVSEVGIYAYNPNIPPTQLPPIFARWEPFDLASPPLRRDPKGGVWMFLADHPKEASSWDGEQWHHVAVPFDTSRVYRTVADDRGHLLVLSQGSDRYSYDVGLDEVKAFPTFQLVLENAVRSGARQFGCGRGYEGICVVAGNKIWYNDNCSLHYYDGERWDQFEMSEPLGAVLESARYGILVRNQMGKFFAYDRGQIVPVDLPKDGITEWLLGPGGIQPFEQELLRRRPSLYVALQGDPENGYFLLPRKPPAEGDGRGESAQVRRDLSRYTKGTIPGLVGGCWVGSAVQDGGLGRIFGGRIFGCDFSGTPLARRSSEVGQVIEDRCHNLWFEPRQGANYVFRKRLDDFRIRAPAKPRYAKESLMVEVEPLPSDIKMDTIRLFWRLNGGPWEGGERGSPVLVRFPEPGQYEVEILGMDPQGGTTTETVKLNIRSSVHTDDSAG
jgi:hypothetical protein